MAEETRAEEPCLAGRGHARVALLPASVPATRCELLWQRAEQRRLLSWEHKPILRVQMSPLTNSSRRKLLHFTLCKHRSLGVSSLLSWITGELSRWTPTGPAAHHCRVLMVAPHRAAPLGPRLHRPKSRWPEAWHPLGCTQGGEGEDNWQPLPSPRRPQTRAQMDMLETCQRFCEGHAGTQSQLISELIK